MVAAILQLYALPRKDSLIHILSFRRCVPSLAATAFEAATPTERITHYTLLRKVVCQMGRCPLWKPSQEKAVRYPSTGRIPPFLVIQPFGCIG